MIRYVFTEQAIGVKSLKRADPQKIGLKLAEISETNNGHLRPRDVWKAAEGHPRHVLHKHFEWDDEKAAASYRDHQARVLINSIRIEESDGQVGPPAYFNVRAQEGRSYRSYGDVMSSQKLRAAVVDAAHKDLTSWTQRYHELRDICEMVEPARAKLGKMKGKNKRAGA